MGSRTTRMETVGVVLSVRNEEAKIERTLASVQWADEIIVVDNESTDETARLVRQYGAKVIRGKNNPMLNINKNFGFTKAKSDWVLSLDGDEVISPELAKEIRASTGKPVDAYWIPRKNILFGKWIRHGPWWPDKQLRLFRRGRGAFPCKHVHEYLSVNGPTADLSSPMMHYNYETISQFIRKMDEIYTVSEVDNLVASGYRVAWYDAIRFPMSDFLKTYFAQQGYKDGLHGLVLSLLQAMYSFVVFAKLWEREKFGERDVPLAAVRKEVARTRKELTYWLMTGALNETDSIPKKLWYRLIRKYAARH